MMINDVCEADVICECGSKNMFTRNRPVISSRGNLGKITMVMYCMNCPRKYLATYVPRTLIHTTTCECCGKELDEKEVIAYNGGSMIATCSKCMEEGRSPIVDKRVEFVEV